MLTLSLDLHVIPFNSLALWYLTNLSYNFRAKVSDATTAVGANASWFKIGEMGLPSSNPDYWATEVLNDNCGHFDVKIPTGIAAGNYLLRAEVIALHVASSVGGAQYVFFSLSPIISA